MPLRPKKKGSMRKERLKAQRVKAVEEKIIEEKGYEPSPVVYISHLPKGFQEKGKISFLYIYHSYYKAHTSIR